jgi:sugar phosphate isomerase/epimerase
VKTGIVTYNIAAEWDLDTIIERCEELDLSGVELRTTHAHGIEVSLSKTERNEVRRRFADSKIDLVGLGSTFEYHSPDAEELRSQIDGTKEYVLLARDVGAAGVKVRPNAFPDGVSKEQTIEQIGTALREVGEFASDHGIEIRLEVHGRGTAHPPYIAGMLDIAGHRNVRACWNCNSTDMDADGSIDDHFALLKDRLGLVHLHGLYEDYPYERLVELLADIGYDGYCLAEIPESDDPVTVLRYFTRLFSTWVEHTGSSAE